MFTRSTAVTAAVAAAVGLATTGITYASAASESIQPDPATYQQVPATYQSDPATYQQVPASSPVQAPFGGDSGRGGEGREFHEGGRIQINERTYSAYPGGCITVISGLGATTFNIRNDTRKTVEFFSGAVCDNGAPVALVGPHSQSSGINVPPTEGIYIEDGVVGSFRVIEQHHGDWF
ncbi:hypothetical protein StrepF001_27765 [Streptomyces sp. F001]|nr:hypothetical protein StrepF001_27765 [Streptomyces sp. F001]